MQAAPLETIAEDGLTCPTCRAKQPWSESCRRCKCDLTLLPRTAATWHRHRRRCLEALRAGQAAAAQGHARRFVRVHPDSPSLRLLAACHLLAGNWPLAAILARRAGLGD